MIIGGSIDIGRPPAPSSARRSALSNVPFMVPCTSPVKRLPSTPLMLPGLHWRQVAARGSAPLRPAMFGGHVRPTQTCRLDCCGPHASKCHELWCLPYAGVYTVICGFHSTSEQACKLELTSCDSRDGCGCGITAACDILACSSAARRGSQ
jgi:hypothetical protein